MGLVVLANIEMVKQINKNKCKTIKMCNKKSISIMF